MNDIWDKLLERACQFCTLARDKQDTNVEFDISIY